MLYRKLAEPQQPSADTETVQDEAPEITDEVIKELFADNDESPKPATDEQRPAAEAEPEVEEEEQPRDQPVTTQQLMGAFQQMVPQIVHATLQNAQQGNQQQARVSVVDQMLQQHPGADRDGMSLLVKTVQTAMTDHPLSSDVNELKKVVAQQSQILASNHSQSLVNDFYQHMDKLFDQAKIVDPLEREMYLETVTNRGARQHGQAFTKEKAAVIFRQLHSQKLKSNHTRTQQYVEDKKTAAERGAPVAHSKAGGAVAESVMKRLTDPSDKSYSFGGKNFNRLLKGLVGG